MENPKGDGNLEQGCYKAYIKIEKMENPKGDGNIEYEVYYISICE